MSAAITHDAFISYNHGADGRLAKALEDGLEKLAKPLLTLRAIDVFRDETSLAANPSLWDGIVAHLSGSAWLVMLACPQWAASPWCAREASWWLENRRPERMLIVLTGGDIAWDAAAGDFDWRKTTALNPELRDRFPDEPLFIDLRWAREHDGLTLRNLRFRDAVLNLAAPIRGLRKDELDGADVRQLHRNRRLVRAGVAMIVVAAAIAVWQAFVATRERDEAVRQARIALGRQLAAEAAAASAQRADLLPLSLLLGIESMRQFASSEADQAIRRGLDLLPREIKALQHQGGVSVLAVQSDGRRFATLDAEGTVRVWNDNGERQYEISGQNHNWPRLVFCPQGKTLATVDQDGHARLWDAGTGEPRPAPPVRRGLITGMAFSPGGESLAVSYASGDEEVTVSTVATGALVRSLELARTTEHSRGLAFGRVGLAAVAYADVLFFDAGKWNDRRLDMPKAQMVDLSFSPDGELLAVATKSDRKVRVFTAADGRPLTALEMGAEVAAVAFSPDGKRLATANAAGEARIWDTDGWNQVVAIRHDGKINALAFNPSGSLLATASSDHTAALWDTVTGEKLASMDHGGALVGVSFIADGQRVVTAGDDGTARIWEADASADAVRFPVGDGSTIAFLPQHIVAIDGRGRSVLSWSRTEPALNTIDFPDNSGPAALSGDGQLALPGRDQVVRRDIASARELAPLRYEGEIDWDEFDRRARQRLSYRPAAALKFEAQARGASPPVAFSPDGRYLFAARADFLARVWDLESGRLMVTEPFEWQITSAAFAPRGQFLALVKDDKSLVVFSLPQGRKVLTAEGSDMRQAIVAGAGDFAGVLQGAPPRQDGAAPQPDRIRLWQSADWKELAPLDLTNDNVSMSPDGEWLAMGLPSKVVRVVELRSGKERARIGSREEISSVVFNPSGTLAALSGSALRTVVWDLRANREALSLADNEKVMSFAFGPQGLMAAGGERTARVLSAQGDTIARFDTHAPVLGVRFSPDGRYIVSAGESTSRVSLWRPADLIDAACTRLNRDITPAQWPAVGGEHIELRVARSCDHTQR